MDLSALLSITPDKAAYLITAVFLAGVVRGFSGFAMSALIMASCAWILPPVQIIPIVMVLEVAASLITLKGGVRDWDRRMTLVLIGASVVGWPIGLALVTQLPVETSAQVALGVILTLAVLQLANVRIKALATTPGLYGTGLMSGIIGGLAAVGGLVVALYVLSQDRSAAVMRASLIIFLLASNFLSLGFQIGFGVMDGVAALRALILLAPALIGVWIGARFFTDRWRVYYRPFCLTVLIGLAGWGLIRMAL